MAALKFILDGQDLEQVFGVKVQTLTGAFTLPKIKKRNSVNFDDSHGTIYDTSKPRYEEREIEMECYTIPGGTSALVDKITALKAILSKAGYIQLLIQVADDSTNPLALTTHVYNVLHNDAAEFDVNLAGYRKVSTFSLKFVEPEPIKISLKATKTLQQFAITGSGMVNVYGINEARQDIIDPNLEEIQMHSTIGGFLTISGDVDDLTIEASDGIEIISKY